MKTNREVLQGFRELVGNGSSSVIDDSKWSNRLVLYHLNNVRVKLLAEKRSSPNLKFNPHNLLSIPCVPTIEIDRNECPCAPASGCTFLKTLWPIPRPISGRYNSVTSITGDVDYTYVRWDRFKDKVNSRLQAERKGPYYSLRSLDANKDPYIYIYNDDMKEFITVVSLFEDPLEVAKLPKCDGSIRSMCSPLDDYFIIDTDLLPVVYQMITEALLRPKAAVQSDNLNDNRDTTNEQV